VFVDVVCGRDLGDGVLETQFVGGLLLYLFDELCDGCCWWCFGFFDDECDFVVYFVCVGLVG